MVMKAINLNEEARFGSSKSRVIPGTPNDGTPIPIGSMYGIFTYMNG